MGYPLSSIAALGLAGHPALAEAIEQQREVANLRTELAILSSGNPVAVLDWAGVDLARLRDARERLLRRKVFRDGGWWVDEASRALDYEMAIAHILTTGERPESVEEKLAEALAMLVEKAPTGNRHQRRTEAAKRRRAR